jgi:group II intron reverse transcriptase/maturase
MHGRGESDSGTVARKHPNNGGPGAPAEDVERNPLAEGNAQQTAAASTRSEGPASPGLLRVREVAKKDKQARFTALLHHITVDALRVSYLALNRKSAPGVDGVTWQKYGEHLETRLTDLNQRVHTGQYRAQPSKRTYIAKEDGSQRALGMAALEDKIVQQALVTVLNQIYEEDFLGFSYGFRPGRSQHQALDALWVGLTRRKVNWVLDLDFQKFFDTIDHGWQMKFLEHRIADKRVLRLIRKWLRAGVSENGEWSKTTVGTPQGAVISPLLANIYLHYVLDLWVQNWRQLHARGDVIIARYADDAVLGFQFEDEARRFLEDLKARLVKFGLTLHPEKTRLIEFGRYAEDRRRRRGEGRPETFNFLGFTHICDSYRRTGEFTVIRRTIQKRMRTRLAAIRDGLRERISHPVPAQGLWLSRVVKGYYQYHAVPGNFERLRQFQNAVQTTWHNILRRRSQRSRMTWARFSPIAKRWIPAPKILHAWPDKRFDARTQGKSRMR